MFNPQQRTDADSDADPDADPDAATPPSGSPRARPPRRSGPRLPLVLILIGLGLLFVIGIGITSWVFSSQDATRFTQEIDELITYEQGASELGMVETILALQDPGDPGWRQARSAQVAQGLANALPVPILTPLPNSLEILQVIRLNDAQAIANVTRQYTTAAGETHTFQLQQFYQFEPDIGWVRTAPWPVFWEAIRVWQGDLVQIVYYAPDEELVERIAPFVNSAVVRACEVWVQCPANQPVNLFITNDPLVFRDNPADNPRVVANLGEYGGDAFNGDLEYAWIASPHLAGMPIDAAGAQLLADSWAMRAIATHAGQISAESQSAAALFTQAIAALGLDTADPGMTFVEPPVVVIEVTPPPTATPGPTATLEFESYIVQSGDTLVGIAIRFGITVDLLLAFNDIPSPENIRVGQELQIPPPNAVPATATAVPTPTPTLTPTPTATPIPAGTIVNYTVQEGQTLVFIALIHETTIDAIVAENGLPNADSIFVGQELRIPYGLARTPVP